MNLSMKDYELLFSSTGMNIMTRLKKDMNSGYSYSCRIIYLEKRLLSLCLHTNLLKNSHLSIQ